ncbi:MAG: hypothetical protein H0V82_00825 [Candidatus Protochlamydia sp.]|nr:hypothetical protein [Candidatus Protochlamydia sp.]
MPVEFTANNRIVLKNYADKIAKKFDVQPKAEPNFFYSKISQYLPTWESTGKKIGESIALTHGQDWTNGTIDFVVEKVFQDKAKQASLWSLEGVKQRITGAAQTTLAESLKLSITPKVLPVLTVFSGVGGQIALPLVVSLIGFAYKKAMHDPEAMKKLSPLSLDELFSVDPETNQLRDGFGNLMTSEDMMDIYHGTAKHALIGKIIQLCQEIDQNPKEAKSLLQVLVNTYLIHRNDGQNVFPDGTAVTDEDRAIIEEGINTLARNNPSKKKNKIRCFIKLLSKHSILPFENLSLSNRNEEGAKKMGTIFSNEEEWKNYILRSEDGCYVVYKDCGDKKRGELISHSEMKGILKDADRIEKVRAFEHKNELEKLMLDPSQLSVLVHKLRLMDAESVRDFLKNYLVQREADDALVYLDGTLLEEKEKTKLLKNLNAIPPRNNLKEREDFIRGLIQQIGGHIPKDLVNQYVISCQDGHCVLKDGSEIENEEADAIRAEFQKYEEAALTPLLKI